jgi:hypothetical protein
MTMNTLMSLGNSSDQTSGARKGLYALIGACILAAALPGCAVFPKSTNPAADNSITADVRSRLAQDGEFIHPGTWDVQTVNGVVYLNGTVWTGLQRRDAEAIARQNSDVVKVVNNLTIAR